MKRFLGLAAGAATAGLLCSTAASAVTADQVWAAMQQRIAAMNMTVTADSQTKSGGTLALKGVKMVSTAPTGQVTISFSELDLAEGGDGSVTITPPATIPLDLHLKNDKGDETDLTVSVTQTGAKTVVTGKEGDLTYNSAADVVTATVDGITSGGKKIDLRMKVGLDGMKGSYHLLGTGPIEADTSGTIDTVSLTIDATNPDGTGTLHGQAQMSGITSSGKMTMVPGVDMKNLAAALAAGYAVDSTLTYGPTTFSFDLDQAPKKDSVAGTVAAGNVTVSLDKGHIQYGGGSTGADVTVNSTESPIPQIAVKIAESAFNLLAPIARSDTPQDFSLLVKLAGLSVNEDVWKMVDAKGVLPHDPATVILDLAGKGKWAFDFFDPAQAATPPAVPGELDALTLKQLQVTAVGAELTGTGDLTFDNSAVPPGGMPKPTGAVNLKLVGGNGLIDKLTQMGVVPQDQAMGARMMLGMFAKPGDGPDTLTSQIEFKPDGAILANGQRIQ